MDNKYRIEGNTMYVEVEHNLTGKTLEALFSVEDKDFLLGLRSVKCCSSLKAPTYYRVTASYNGYNGNVGRILLQAPKGMHVDHINRNGLDNRRENLRIVTREENLRNRKEWAGSGFKSVYKKHGTTQWKVMVHLGTFETAEEAAKVAQEARAKLGLPA